MTDTTDSPFARNAPCGRQVPVTLATAWHNFWFNFRRIEGRASRSEFWWMALVLALSPWVMQLVWAGLIAVGILLANLTTVDFFVAIGDLVGFLAWAGWGLAVIVPSFCLNVRRLHDVNLSGWFLLLHFIPILGQVALIIFYLLPSTPGPNRFGPVPNVE